MPKRSPIGSEARETTVSRSAGRVLDLLGIVVTGGAVNLTSAAAAADLTPTTALRHLRALEGCAYLQRDDQGLYSAGPTFLRLALTALGDGPNAHLIAVADPYLRGLADETGESAYLAISDGSHAVYVACCESRRAIRHVGWVGNTVPLHTTAIGAALLGADGACVRSGSVEPDIAAVAMGVNDRTGTTIAAMSVIGPAHRMGPSEVAAATGALTTATSGLAVGLDARPEEAAS